LSKDLSNRTIQQHFSTGKTGSSTLRRTVGAILKVKLSLEAIPRSYGRKEKDFCNYRFENSGEVEITEWMHTHLKVAVHSSINYKNLENLLVQELQPRFNLTKCSNPNRKLLMDLRKLCANEARRKAG
jgi:hypothetical protein